MKIIRSLSPKCQKVSNLKFDFQFLQMKNESCFFEIVWERMREQAKDVRLNIGLLEACREEAEH